MKNSFAFALFSSFEVIMAELILSPIAKEIIGRLASVAVLEIASVWGVNDELDELQNTISIIDGVLADAEK